MIDRHQLGRACTENDRYAELGRPMDQALPDLGFDHDDATYVAYQRALRMYGLMYGRNFREMTLKDTEKLSSRERMIFSAMATMFIDGLAAASRALDAEGRDGR
jgi:hypothetical protein